MEHHRIPGTPVFNGEAAQKGYALNKMCFLLQQRGETRRISSGRGLLLREVRAHARAAQGGQGPQCSAMIAAGGNVYYLAKLAGIFGLNVQDIGAQQTGMTVEQFKANLQAAGR